MLQLVSRRIGTRPNTKMHYSNVRLAPPDEAATPPSAPLQQATSTPATPLHNPEARHTPPQPQASATPPQPSQPQPQALAQSPSLQPPSSSPTLSSSLSVGSPFVGVPAFISPLAVSFGSSSSSEQGLPLWNDDAFSSYLSGTPPLIPALRAPHQAPSPTGRRFDWSNFMSRIQL
jgi:hypothetical protein